jgi:hypothetical protein
MLTIELLYHLSSIDTIAEDVLVIWMEIIGNKCPEDLSKGRSTKLTKGVRAYL